MDAPYLQVLSLLDLLVQKYKYWGTEVQKYKYWGTTKVQILRYWRSYRDKHDRGDIKGGMRSIDERIRIVARVMPAEVHTPELLYEVNPKFTCFHYSKV